MKKIEMDEYNKALGKFARELGEALIKYFKNGYVNMPAIIGILEDKKIGVSNLMHVKNVQDGLDPNLFQKNKMSYIG